MAVYADHPYPLIETPAYRTRLLVPVMDPDMFERVASEMACVHNMIIRGLNSIVLQAPHVQAADVPSFVGYAIQWYRLLHVHHTSEETDFFVSVERMTGQKGVMDDNVEQHAAFSEGIEAFKRYLDVCAKRPGEFDGHKIVRMLDEIGHPLVLHLTDEVPTLLYLRRFGDKMDSLEKVFGEEGERNMLGLLKGLPWCFVNHDITFEEGRWAKWPPAPKIVVFLCKNVFYWLHRDMWKFGSCDRAGRLKPLQVPAGK